MKIEEGINSNPTEHPKQTSINEEFFLFYLFSPFSEIELRPSIVNNTKVKMVAKEIFE